MSKTKVHVYSNMTLCSVTDFATVATFGIKSSSNCALLKSNLLMNKTNQPAILGCRKPLFFFFFWKKSGLEEESSIFLRLTWQLAGN